MKAAQKIHDSTQKFTEIVDIVEDVVLLSGGAAALVIEVRAANFALLSKEEQDAKIYAYASLLNSLSFSIQIVIRNKRVDISSYLKLLDSEVQKAQTQQLSSYIAQYRNFIAELVKVNMVLDKKFYIVVPYSPLEKGITGANTMVGNGKKSTGFEAAKQALHSKAESLHAQLARIGLLAQTLQKEELVKLYYDIYNQDVGETQIATEVEGPIVKARFT